MKGRRWPLGLWLPLMLGMSAAHAQDKPVERGAAVFEQHCAVCHQPDAKGAPGFAPPLRGAHWARLTVRDDYVTKVLLFGLTGRIGVAGNDYDGVMPAFAQLGHDDLASVINHLERLNAGTPTHTAQGVARLAQVPVSAKSLRALRSELLKE